MEMTEEKKAHCQRNIKMDISYDFIYFGTIYTEPLEKEHKNNK